jgi:hypothetical protein
VLVTDVIVLQAGFERQSIVWVGVPNVIAVDGARLNVAGFD